MRAEAKLRGGLGEDRVAGRGGERRRPAPASRRIELAARDDQPAGEAADALGDLVEQRRPPAPRGAGRDGGQRALAAALERERRGGGDVRRARLGARADRARPGSGGPARAAARPRAAA